MNKQTISLVLATCLMVTGTMVSNSSIVSASTIKSMRVFPVDFLSSFDKFLKATNILLEEREKEIERLALEQEQIEREQEAERMRVQNVGYDENNLLKTSNINYDELYAVLDGTGIEHLTWALVESERQYGINVFFISAIVALESGWCTSQRSNNGSNNLTGMDVPSDSSPGTYYSSQDECVLDTARQLKEYYLTENAIYHNGYSSYAVNIKYCQSSDWHSKIDQIAYELYDKYVIIFKGGEFR